MMKCEYCGAELVTWGAFCPVCGKENAQSTETAAEQIPVCGISLEEITEPVDVTRDQQDASTNRTKKTRRILAMSGCVALLAVLAAVLFFGIRGGWNISDWFKKDPPRENNLFYKDSFTVSDKQFQKHGDTVVATLGQEQLTNTQLQFYYWTEVYDFMGSYGYYLSYIGFDYTKPLSEQTCYFDKTMTWEQFFLKSALEVWQSNVAFAQIARQEGFQMPEKQAKYLETMADDLTKTAKEQGYDSVDAMVQSSFGAGCSLDDYINYMETYYLGYLYFAELYNAIAPTDEELADYFTANQAALEESGIKKDDTYTVDIRHILVMIDKIAEGEQEETQKDASDKKEYSEEDWEACRVAAQEIYDLYLAGELTEERFGELANQYSHDYNEEDGQVTNGGLYTGVYEGKMVEAFDDWCFDPTRQTGDTGLVKTEYGYHVMYFVGKEATWIGKVRQAYVTEKSNEIVANTLEQFASEIDYTKIVLSQVSL